MYSITCIIMYHIMYLHVSPGGKHIPSSELHQPGDLADPGIQASIADFRRGRDLGF